MIGTGAGYSNINANYNVFVGSNAGYYSTEGPYNTFVETNSGYYNSTGSSNSLIGYQSGLNNTTGQKNTYMGVGSGAAIATGNENVFIGYETCAYGLSYGNDGTGSNNVAVGFQAGFSSLYSNGNVFIGNQAGFNETNSNKLYIDNSDTSTPLIWRDFSLNRIVINGNASNPPYNFYVNGTAGGLFPWTQASDRNLKENIIPIDHALQKIKALEGVSFEWIDKENYGSERSIGFIAQDVENILPEVVVKSDGHYAMQYAPITALLVEAVKEQQQIIENSESKILALEQRIEQLESLLEKMVGK